MAKGHFLPAEQFEDVEFSDVELGEPEEQTSADKKTESIFSALNEDSEAYVMIYREITGYRDKELVTSLPADKFDLGELVVYLQSNYGGGDYRIIGYKNKKIAANQLIKIAHKIAKDADKPSETLGIMEMMRQMNEQNQRIIRELAERQNGQPQKSTMDMLQEMALMKEVMGTGSAVDPMAMMTQTMGMLKDLGVLDRGESGGGGGDSQLSSMMGMVGKLAEAAKNQPQQMQQQMPQQQRPLIPQQIRQNPQARQPYPPAPPIPMQPQRPQISPELIDHQIMEQIQMNPMLKAGIEMLYSYAKDKADAGEVAARILDMIPENEIKAFILSPKSFTTLCALKRELVDHKAWFDDLSEHVKAALGLPSKFADLWGEDTPEDLAAGMPNTQAPTSAEMRDAFDSGEITDAVTSTLSPDLQLADDQPIIDPNSEGDFSDDIHTTNDTRGPSGD